ncbi:MAG: threonine-phosphate decarboxylase [Deltaproteobacteria bacterium]|nr:threonine-phosphate decarboxylase [Deltaproteobacteria bacterium]
MVDILEREAPYRHGGTPDSDLERFGLPVEPILDFSVNINFMGPPANVREKWGTLFEVIADYPPVQGDGIARYYQEKFNIPPENLLAGNGSTEMIYLAPRALGLHHVVVITPSYHDYERASILAGARVDRHRLSPASGFSLPIDTVPIQTMENADALWLGRPNNPTGTLVPKEPLLELSKRFPKTVFIIDEAFIQFADNWEQASFLTQEPRPNILVIHSITKFYALAGIRLGGIVGHEKLISRLRQAKEPWTINGVADRIAPLLLECTDYEQETWRANAEERERIFHLFGKLEGITPFPPCANFILCQWTRTHTLDHLIHYLLSNGMYVRDCRNFPGLEANFFRVGIRKPVENNQLISLISSFPDGVYG